MSTNKALIDALLRKTIAFHQIFGKVAGGATAGLFLSQAYYWTGKGTENGEPIPGGWFYKVMPEWEDETSLTRTEQENARKKLRELGVLEEQRRGVPAKLYFRVNEARLYELIEEAAIKIAGNPQTEIAGNPQTEAQFAGNPQSRPRESRSQGRGKAADQGEPFPQPLHRVPQKNTHERDPSNTLARTASADDEKIRRVYIQFVCQEFGDEAPMSSVGTRGVRLFQRWRAATGGGVAEHLEVMYAQREKLRKQQGRQRPGERIEKKGPYFFRLMEEQVELAERGLVAAG